MRRDKVYFLLVRMIGRHVRKIRRVFVHRRFGRVRLKSLSDAVKVKFVGIPLAMHFGHDVLVIVISEGSAQLVVIHVGFALALPPTPGYLVGVRHLELPVGSFPSDAAGIGTVGEQLQEKLP